MCNAMQWAQVRGSAGTSGDQRPPRSETDEKAFLGKYAQERSGEG